LLLLLLLPHCCVLQSAGVSWQFSCRNSMPWASTDAEQHVKFKAAAISTA